VAVKADPGHDDCQWRFMKQSSRRLQVIRRTATSPADKIHSVYFAARMHRRASDQCWRQNRHTLLVYSMRTICALTWGT